MSTITPPQIVLDNHLVSGVLGKEIRSAADENMGRIIDVIVDRAGMARAAVIDFGGFLGVGSRKIAVDWNALHFALQGRQQQTRHRHARNDLKRDQVKAAPGVPGRQAAHRAGCAAAILRSLPAADRNKDAGAISPVRETRPVRVFNRPVKPGDGSAASHMRA